MEFGYLINLREPCPCKDLTRIDVVVENTLVDLKDNYNTLQ